jgi:hypothetical protein
MPQTKSPISPFLPFSFLSPLLSPIPPLPSPYLSFSPSVLSPGEKEGERKERGRKRGEEKGRGKKTVSFL